MKKRLILTILTALLFGACSNQNEVSQNETEKPVGFVQKEEKAKNRHSAALCRGDPTGNNRGTCLPGICPVRPAEQI